MSKYINHIGNVGVELSLVFFVLLLSSGPGIASAQEEDLPEVDVEVHGRPESIETDRVENDEIFGGARLSYGEALLELAGVSASRHAAGATEPVVRGLGGERVATQAGPVPLRGACPSSMDPPVTYLAAHSASSVDLVRGLASVRLGPGGTGGRIIFSPGMRLRFREAGIRGRLANTIDLARHGFGLTGEISAGSRRVAASLGGEMLRLGDYRSGAGTLVPAGHDRYGVAITLAAEPRVGRRLWTTVGWTHERDVDFPSLPMDNEETDFWLATLGYHHDRQGSMLRSIHAEGGVAIVDHLMSNRNKPNRGMLEASTLSDALSFGGQLELRLRPRRGMDLWTGVDMVGALRDAVRSRFVVAQDRLFTDHLWPEASQWGIGLFAELRVPFTRELSVTAGARGTVFVSSAGAPDDPAIGGQSVSEAWSSFWGTEAVASTRVEGTGGASVSLLWQPAQEIGLHFGTALAMRPAGLTERYFAYGPAPGGFQVGNPTLDAEIKWDTVAGIRTQISWLDAAASVFYAWVPTYILRQGVDHRDVDGDGQPELIRSFDNISAQVAGFELTAELRAGSLFSFPISLSFVRGWNHDSGGDLAAIPPFELAIAARISVGSQLRGWLELGGRFVAAQRRIDDRYPENETEGFELLSTRAGISYRDRLRLVLYVENLLDIEYNEHLTHEALLPSGDLAAGAEVPSMGRRVALSLSVTLD